VVVGVALLGACSPQQFNLPVETRGDDSGAPPDTGPPVDEDGGIDPVDAGDAPPGPDAPDAIGDAIENETGGDAGDPRCVACAAYGAVTEIGPLPPTLVELSGIIASRRHPGIFYAHNDSGDTARFFALNDKAEIEAELDLRGAVATDWEDIALGPCEAGARRKTGPRHTNAGGPTAAPSHTAATCVYLGDIGDNNLIRAEYAIYRVAEPDELPSGGQSTDIAYERFPFVYPDGPHNAETLLVHPATGRIFVVTKVGGVVATVYEYPLPPKAGEVTTLVKVMPVSVPAEAGLITAGDFHPCSQRLLLRTYSSLFEMTSADGVPESIFAATPVPVPAAVEPQGEAVTYGADGRSYYMAGETVSAAERAKLSVAACP
jgi:hypothetical protein